MSARRLLRWLNLPAWGITFVALAIWQLVAEGADLEYLPGPVEVADELASLVSSGKIGEPLGHTLWITVTSSLIACGVGLLAGLAIGLVPAIRTYWMASVDVLRTVPVVALMPVALLIWGPESKTEVVVASYAAVWPILINTVGGTAEAHAGLREVARMFRLSRAATVRKIVIPAAAPQLLVGARLAIVTALVVSVVAEMLVNPAGLGWEVVLSQQSLQPARMWAYIVVTGLLGYVLNVALIAAARLAFPGGANQGLEAGR